MIEGGVAHFYRGSTGEVGAGNSGIFLRRNVLPWGPIRGNEWVDLIGVVGTSEGCPWGGLDASGVGFDSCVMSGSVAACGAAGWRLGDWSGAGAGRGS